jgi:hypothetical protein
MSLDNEIVKYAVEDLQRWMASVGRDTTESAVAAWQAGYIAGVNRAVGLKEQSAVEEL